MEQRPSPGEDGLCSLSCFSLLVRLLLVFFEVLADSFELFRLDLLDASVVDDLFVSESEFDDLDVVLVSASRDLSHSLSPVLTLDGQICVLRDVDVVSDGFMPSFLWRGSLRTVPKRDLMYLL